MRFQNPKLKMQTRCAYKTAPKKIFANLSTKDKFNKKDNISIKAVKKHIWNNKVKIVKIKDKNHTNILKPAKKFMILVKYIYLFCILTDRPSDKIFID